MSATRNRSKSNRNRSLAAAWQVNAQEFTPPLRLQEPIWIRHGTVRSGVIVPTPEFHHCCEFSTILQGSVQVTVGGEMCRRLPGDVFLVPPGLPHDARVLRYPMTYVTVFFLPSLLIEMAPERDGPLLLSRFLRRQPLRQRLRRLPLVLRRKNMQGFADMVAESHQQDYGWEIRLRILLLDLLVQFQRWERKQRPAPISATRPDDWSRLHHALRYLREHFTETIYARDIARVTGTSESRLRALFHDTIGNTWGHHLETLRCEQAAGLFCDSSVSVTQAALAAGFQSLSSFNTSFQRVMHCSPTAYRTRVLKPR